jgi:hypothetical protein
MISGYPEHVALEGIPDLKPAAFLAKPMDFH